MSFFKKLSLKSKIFIAISIMSVLICASGVVTYRNVLSMMDSQKWVTHTVGVIQKLKELQEYMIDMETGQRGYLMSGDEQFLEPYNKAIGKFEPALKSLQQTVSDNPVQVERLARILKLKEEWIIIANDKEMSVRKKMDNGQISKEEFEKELKAAHGKRVMDAIRGEVAAAVDMEEKLNVERKARNINTASFTLSWIMYGLSFSLLMGIIFLYVILTRTIKSIFQISQRLNDSSEEVSNVSDQAAKTSRTLEKGSSEQASSLQETSSSMTEISSMISRNSDNAKRASENSKLSKDSAIRGKDIVSKMISSMNEISESNKEISNKVEESNQEMTKIIHVISEIGDKTKVINDIVFQTKLLSFNASVEAARAGEAGKGFAVVAEEVGSLAQMSGKAAGEISEMLNESVINVERIIEKTKSGVEGLIREGATKIENGIKVSGECGEVLDEIVENISKVNKLSNEISTGSEEQADGVSEVSSAISQLNTITSQNSTMASESSTISAELAKQSEYLRNLICELDDNIQGQKKNGHNSQRVMNNSNVISFKKSEEIVEKKISSKKVSGSDITTSDDDFADL